MHEMSITQSMVEICLEHAAGRRVTEVTLLVGELAGVVPEAVEFCFEACTRATPLEGARLIVERVPGRARCHECGADFPIHAYFDPCPGCGGYRHEVTGGEELRIKDLEVE